MQWPVLPDYGCIFRWPVDGVDFIHPEDQEVALRCFPSERVFRREKFDGEYYHYRYGDVTFRLRPVMWLKVREEGIDVGDQVETIGVGLERDRFVAQVWGMYYLRRKGRMVYRLRRGEQEAPRLYTSDELKSLTDKSKIEAREGIYPSPQWKGETDQRLAFPDEKEN
jgi:hypothetical protein